MIAHTRGLHWVAEAQALELPCMFYAPAVRTGEAGTEVQRGPQLERHEEASLKSVLLRPTVVHVRFAAVEGSY